MPDVIDVPQIKPKPAKGRAKSDKLDKLPRYAVILHNDDEHSMDEVVAYLMQIFGFSLGKATLHMLEAHYEGRSTVMVTHQERAELYRDKMRSKTLIASIERLD
ncbi:MAG: ATP-dependent Clp protease adaptor ClpS [Gemmatimonadetes bacterium]|nr:MAG: ATP-dependent Clp protease adaptor ClpS [Gemmatimonadota bacterium]